MSRGPRLMKTQFPMDSAVINSLTSGVTSQITKFPFACTDETGRSAEAVEPAQLWFCFHGLWQ